MDQQIFVLVGIGPSVKAVAVDGIKYVCNYLQSKYACLPWMHGNQEYCAKSKTK